MDDSFFRSHWNSPFYPVRSRPSTRGVPVHDVRMVDSPRVVAVQPKQGIRSAEPSRVVTIPVQYVDSNRKKSESELALRIQKVFRGFVVRKSVKKIAGVRREVEEMEKRISAKETVDLVRRDSRERLKVSEMLMSLLLRLDSVRGVDSGVRDCRKRMIRRVIALQEALDAIVAVDENSASENSEEEAVEIAEAVEEEEQPSDPCPATQFEHQSPDLIESATETDETKAPQVETEPSPEKYPEIAHENERNEAEAEGKTMEEMGRTESQTDSSENPEIREEEGNEEKQRRTEEEKGKEMLERMMEENERMMGMMTELFERNELQTRLLSSLSQRVEQLEKAFVCDRLRRKKRRNATAAKVESPEGKKPGR